METKEFWKGYPKQKADCDAYFSVHKEKGIFYVAMFYGHSAAINDSKSTNGEIWTYKQLLGRLGKGDKFYFYNFYLS